VEVELHAFLTSALDRVERLFHASPILSPEIKAHATQYMGGFLDPKYSEDAVETREIYSSRQESNSDYSVAQYVA
jgi:hypothetical protein